MRKFPREKARPFIFVFAGAVLIVISVVLSIEAIIASSLAVSIMLLFLGGVILIGFGWYAARKAKRSERIEG